MPFFQNWLVHNVAARLGKGLNTTVTVKNVKFTLFNNLKVEGVYVEDRNKDTILSAGLMQVNITDWFFLKDSADLKYIKLKDVTAKLYRRRDSVWNYQFLIDYFGSGSKKPDSSSGIGLHLEAVDLENVRIFQLDQWRGKSLIAGIGKLHLEANEIDFKKSNFDIDKLVVERPEYREFKKAGLWKAADSINYWKRRDALREADTLPKRWNGGGMVFKIKELEVKDGSLEFYNRMKEPSVEGVFDSRDIVISGLSGRIKDLRFIEDTLRASVDLKAKERSGIEIKRIVTQLTINPKMMEFANLDLQTNESRLTNYYAMHYGSMDNMDGFIDQVRISAKLQNSTVSMHDIGFFAPLLKTKRQVVLLTGNAHGTIGNFVVRGLDLRTGGSRLTGSYSMEGLTDIDKTIINFQTPGSQIDLNDVAVWSPNLLTLKNTPVGKLGTVTYTGNFTGTVYDFKAKGLIQSDAGSTEADFTLKMEGPGKGYTGVLRNAKFNGKKLFGTEQLGNIEFNGTVNSSGFGAGDPLHIKGSISKGEYAGYTYKNINADAVYLNNKLTSTMQVDDENLAGKFETVLDFNAEKQRYNGTGTLATANLKALGFMKDSLRFSGEFDIDFQGKTIDDFLGHARFYNAKVINGKVPLSFDSLLLQSEIDTAGVKTLTLRTTEMDAYVQGKFNLSDLSNGFQFFLSRYYPAIIKAPVMLVKDQDFIFNITTRKVEPYLAFINKNIKGLDFAKVAGSLNTNTKELLINADVPAFYYGRTGATNISLKGNGDGERLNVYASIDNLQANDSLNFPNAVIRINTNQDTTHLIATTSTAGPLGDAELDAFIYSKKNGVEARFNESSFIVNSKKWTIQSEGNIKLENGYLTSNGIALEQDQQYLRLYTTPNTDGNWNDMHLEVKNLNTADLLPYFISEPRLEGLATGTVTVTDPLGKPHITSKMQVDQFRFNNDSVGTVSINADYSTRTKHLLADVESNNRDYDLSGTIELNLNDSVHQQMNNIIKLRNTKIDILQKYLGSVFDNVDGYATGDIQMVGKLSKPSLLGNVTLRNATLKVGYTKCIYTIDSALLKFGDNYIDFGTITLKDERKRTGVLEGRFYHRFFDSLSFNLKMRSDGMTILNTKATDNDLFFGKAVARATLDLRGPLNKMVMRVTGTPTDSSHIYISNKMSRESGIADFIVFKTYGREMTAVQSAEETNLHIDLDLNANRLCNIDVILDELTGDVIRAVGSGNIKISTGTLDPTIMRGRYKIEKGSYNYNFQALIRKPFIFSEDDDNYIEWTGDPVNANLNINAKYLATNVSMNSLVGNSSSTNTTLDQSARNAKGDVNVIAIIRGSLSKPDIDFDIEFAPGSQLRNNPSALDMLRRIREDNTEKLRQVTYLLVFKSFAPYKEASSLSNPGADLAVNTISEIVSREMGKILTDVLHQVTGDKSLNLDINTNFYNSSQWVNGTATTSSVYDRVNVGFNLNRAYFNNRVVVNLGSDFDVSVRNTSTNGFEFLPNVSVEFILTSNRRLRGILFKKDNLDIGGRQNRAGASISYRKNFDKVFGNNKEDALFFIRNEARN